MLRALLPFLAILSLAAPALALESAPVRSERARMSLAAELDAVAPGQPFRLGLRQVLAPGWHTYWRNPGDAGAPPEISFTAPEGTRTTGFDWPAPQRIPFGPLVNYGYEGSVLLPLTVTPPASLKPGEVFTLEAEANWLVCEQVCVPEEGSFRLDFPVEAAARPDPALAGAFREAEAALPRPSPWRASLGFAGEGGALRLDGTDLAPASVREAAFFPAEPTVLNHAAPQPLTVAEGALRLGLTRGAAPLPPGPVAGVVVLTDAAGSRSAYSLAATPGPVPAALEVAPAALSLWQAALLAALGGLVLNLMPCVFPILAMKAMALARLSGAAKGAVRGHAASYTAGVLLCFLALAGLLLALRAAGVVAGWGFQFTAPAFVAGMGWLMLAVGLNLSGVFQIGGPVGAGTGLAARGGHFGSFATGALAVLVATPCTAPFMATAIGAALTMPPAATLAIFAAMGLGMAAPYALLALAPGLAGLLPRPGTWMERLREFLAFPMYGAALWLLWVLAQLVGPEGLAAALAGALGIGFAAWALGAAQRARTPRGRWLGRTGGALALLAALAALPGLATAPVARAGAAAIAEDGAEPFSSTRLAALRAEGRPVFVNLTAAWCITCKVNERVALGTEAVRAAFARQGVAYLKGDWTDGNATLAAVLRAHGRAGVPLYLVYPAGGGEPAVLPQILTESMVLRAIGAGPA
ncbi:protein-disulfide reductase DsbD family protein [Roseomonas sp. E05]|uniref:protein-disulfide reductase DsbD family protein n=1 Tax=Roseomonas sp. E05 TaxID=3046310 RepID=UPI0024BAE303|nr:protein-disulfide reductase DsbD domain-containing protein [Roseomonas sp. E05]MDJ0387589.1 protein-disulfide reductase DsbD family protein [Roseomonas sp. E05]